MIRAFVDEALNPGTPLGQGQERRVDAKLAAALITQVAARRDVDPVELDHAIWKHQRAVRRARRP